MSYSTENIRNITLLGQQGAGKTTLIEAILYRTGLINKLGKITDGNTVCDYDWLEKERGFTINPSLAHTTWKENKINLIDTPGFADLLEKIRPILKVVESALIIISPDTISRSEVQITSRYLTEEKLPRLIFLNKIETDQIDLLATFKQLEQQLKLKPVPLTYPLIKDKKVIGIIDIIEMKGRIYNQGKIEKVDIPEDAKSTINQLRENLTEAIAETNDELIEKYLEEGQLTSEEIKQGLKKAIVEADLVPLLIGSALQGIGIDILLDTIVSFFPSPAWKNSIKAVKAGAKQEDEQKEIEIKIVWKLHKHPNRSMASVCP